MAAPTIRAGIPAMDNCRILTRLKAFLVDQGVCATLEHVVRNTTGNPYDLSEWLAASVSESTSVSVSDVPAGVVKLRVKEWLGQGVSAGKIWTVYGEAVDPTAGLIRVTLTEDIVAKAGIYEMNWGVLDENGKPVVVDRGLLSVERSLFAPDVVDIVRAGGPPTIQEIRMRLMDSAANENTLLDDIEFKDEQILLAIGEPVRVWNETPPPLRPAFTTRNFPYRGAWLTGIMAQLHFMMANHFRRNTFRGSTGATSDKDKEREYMAEGNRLWQEYMAFVMTKKVEINIASVGGYVPSEYAGGTW